MNFLAHLWLADQAEVPLAGAILGDVVRGRVAIGAEMSAEMPSPTHTLPAALARSILLHRRIDAVTDRDLRVRAAVARFEPGARRYAGIVLDLVFDHLLAQAWSEFSDETLHSFAARAALEVERAAPWFAQAGRRAPDARRFRRLLLSYKTRRGQDCAIRRTASRLRQPQGLLDAARGWPLHIDALQPELGPLMEALRVASDDFMRATPLPD